MNEARMRAKLRELDYRMRKLNSSPQDIKKIIAEIKGRRAGTQMEQRYNRIQLEYFQGLLTK